MSYQISIHPSIIETKISQWEEMADHLPVSMNYDYLGLLEKLHSDQFDVHYVFISKEEKTVGILYFQTVKFKGAYVKNFFRTNENSGLLQRIFYGIMDVFFELMSWNLLLTGNIFFTGEGGVYFTDDVSDDEAADLIHQCYLTIAGKSKKSIHGLMMNNVYDNGIPYIHHYLKKFKYAAYPVDPDMFMNFKMEWNSFDDYLSSLNSKYRVRMKKVIKNSNEIEGRLLSHEEVAKLSNDIHALYLSTAANVDLNLGYLDSTYFEEMSDLFGDRFQLIGYFKEAQLIGFMSLLRIDTAIDVNYMGMDYAHSKRYSLYNRMLVDLVKLGIELKAETMHLGRTATEIKSTIGAEAKKMMIYLSSPTALYAKGMRFFQSYFGSPRYTLRQPFKQ